MTAAPPGRRSGARPRRRSARRGRPAPSRSRRRPAERRRSAPCVAGPRPAANEPGSQANGSSGAGPLEPPAGGPLYPSRGTPGGAGGVPMFASGGDDRGRLERYGSPCGAGGDRDGIGHRGGQPQETLRLAGRRRGRFLPGRPGGDLRPARPQRRREDHHGGVPPGAAARGRRPGAGPGTGPAAADPAAPPPDRVPAPGGGAPRPPQGVGGPGPVRLARAHRDRLAGADGAVGADRQAEGVVRRPVGRAAPAPVRGAGAGERPRGGVPGRADPGAGPRGPAGGLGAHPRDQGARRHGGAGHPLHGRGRAALRPDRGGRRRAGGRHRHAAGADLQVRRPGQGHLHA